MGVPSRAAAAPSRCALALASALALALAGCDGADADETPARDAAPPPAVEAVPAREGTLPLVERLSGVARAANQVQLRPEVAGVVAEVLVRSGDRVRAGQPLVRIRAATERDQLEQARAAVDLAEASGREADARVAELEAQVVRARALAAEELVSALDIERLEAQLAAAEAARAQERARLAQTRASVEEHRTALDRTTVRAPIDGHVGRRNVEVGMRVDPSTLLFVLGTLDRLIVEAPLTEAMLGYVREGQRVQLGARSLGDGTIEARVSRISPFLAERSFSTMAEIDVAADDGRLRPGMFVTVDILYGESQTATILPSGAVWEEPRTGEPLVFVVGETEGAPALAAAATDELSEVAYPIERRPVTVVAEGRGAVGVRGVSPGEWVVTVGQHVLADREAAAGRVRPTTWERIERLQSLQREDLLSDFLDKQQRVARERGAEPPPNEEYVGRAAPGGP
jgi:RND family efflux transporter MFP subunit